MILFKNFQRKKLILKWLWFQSNYSLIIWMDDYDEFSDNSIEITINEFSGKGSH